MAFHDREYDVHVLLGNPATSPPWVHSIWTNISKALDPLMQVARDRQRFDRVNWGLDQDLPINDLFHSAASDGTNRATRNGRTVKTDNLPPASLLTSSRAKSGLRHGRFVSASSELRMPILR